MKTDTYLFRREDTGEIVHLKFDKMIHQDAMGYLTLDDGVVAKRVHRTHKSVTKGSVARSAKYRTHISDTLGVGKDQVPEMEADAKLHGMSGVEWKEDPTAKGFYQAHFESPNEWRRYVKHRELEDHNGLTKANALGPGDFEKAVERMKSNPIKEIES